MVGGQLGVATRVLIPDVAVCVLVRLGDLRLTPCPPPPLTAPALLPVTERLKTILLLASRAPREP